MNVWRQSLDEVLKYVVGKDVDVVNSFRLGKFNSNKKDQLLVKLRTVWDRRIILQTCWKLKNYRERVYIWADEPIEVRRSKIFERIKNRALRDNKIVVVDNDLLIVDNVPVYSLISGYVRVEQA